jgi:ABC-type polysaccharide/polyol phosphate export permease
MNTVKKLLGYVWMALSPIIIVFLVLEAFKKISHATENLRSNVILQWSIILLIFIPICIGFFIFGWYASKDEYAQWVESSQELNE